MGGCEGRRAFEGYFPPVPVRLLTVDRGIQFLARLVTHDVSRLPPGAAVRSVMLNAMGGIIDVVWVFRDRAGGCTLILRGEMSDADEAWIRQVAVAFDAEIESADGEAVFLAGSVPSGCGLPEVAAGRGEVRNGLVFLGLGWISMAAGSAGIVGKLAGRLDAAGVFQGDWAIFDTLRILAREPMPLSEFDESVNPVEAGLVGALDFSDPARIFIGRAICEAMTRKGSCPFLRLVSFLPPDDAVMSACGGTDGLRGRVFIRCREVLWPVTSIAILPGKNRMIGLSVLPSDLDSAEVLEAEFQADGDFFRTRASIAGNTP